MIIGYSFGVAKVITPEMVRAFNIASKDVDLHFYGLIDDNACNLFLENIPSFQDRFNKLKTLVNISNIMAQKSLDPLENIAYLRKRFPGCEIHVYHDDEWDSSLIKKYVKRFGNGDVHVISYKEIIDGVNINYSLMNKSQMLSALKKISTKAEIDEFYSFYVNDYKQFQDEIVHLIKEAFKGSDIVIRSSLDNEDNFADNHIRHIEGINSGDKNSVIRAINKLIRAYENKIGEIPLFSKILVQKQNKHIAQYGEIYSKELHKGRAYYLIRYNDVKNLSSLDSSPLGTEVFVARNLKPSEIESPWNNLVSIMKEFENATRDQFLAMRWGMKNDGKFIIYTVQHLSTKLLKNRAFDNEDLFVKLNDVGDEYVGTVSQNASKAVNLSTKGLLTPTEFIHNRCFELEYSLFEEILAKTTYSSVYKTVGYCGSPFSLTRRIGNKAYGSVSDCTYCTIPDNISGGLKNKIHTIYKNLPDKYQNEYFSHVIETFSFDINKKMDETFAKHLSKDEKDKYRKGLTNIASRFMSQYFDSIAELSEHTVEAYKLMLKDKDLFLKTDDTNTKIDILRDVILYDKAIMAFGYVYSIFADKLARNILNSLLNIPETVDYAKDILDHTQNSDYDLVFDLNKLFTGRFPILDFNDKYGDIRLCTFDLLSPNIKDLDFDFEEEVEPLPTPKPNRVNIPINKLEELISKAGLDIDAISLGVFLSSALKQRTYFRHYFDKATSLVIDVISELAKFMNLNLRDFRHLTLADIYASQKLGNVAELSTLWRNAIEYRKETFLTLGNLVLPDNISKKIDLSLMKFVGNDNLVSDLPIDDVVELDTHIQLDPQYRTVFLNESFYNYQWVLAYNIPSLIVYRGDRSGDLAHKCYLYNIPNSFETGRINYAKIEKKSF